MIMPRARRLLGLTLALGAPVLTHAGEIPTLPGWTLSWHDNFEGPAGSLPSTELWRIDTGHGYPGGPPNWGTSETERFTRDPSNLQLDGKGHLLITPQRLVSGEWTSGRVETVRDDFTPPPGGAMRMEARIQMPDVTGVKALGYWPAFWALGSDFRTSMAWPQASEFDIMESVNGLDGVWGILHCGINPAGPCGEPMGIGSHLPCPHEACTAGPHTFAFEWDRSVSPEQMRWYVDGQVVNQVAENQMPADTWRGFTGKRGYYMLLDVAVGGGFSFVMAGWKATPTTSTEPGHSMVVDYVAVWTKGGHAAQAASASSTAAPAAPKTP